MALFMFSQQLLTETWIYGSISLEDNTGDEDKKIKMKSRILFTLKVVIVKLKSVYINSWKVRTLKLFTHFTNTILNIIIKNL